MTTSTQWQLAGLIVDASKMEWYKQGVLATMTRYEGRYVVLGGQCDSLEGKWQLVTAVLIRFPSLAQAYKWYNSEEYKELKELRLTGSKCQAVFMESDPSEFVSEQ